MWRDEQSIAAARLTAMLLADGRHEEAYRTLVAAAPPPPPAATVRGFVSFALAPLDGKIAVWRQRADAVDFRWALLDAAAHDRLARRLVRLASHVESSPNAIQETARQLGEGLFGDWLRQIEPGQGIALVADPALAEIPLGLLPGAQREIGLDHAVVMGGAPVSPAAANGGRIVVVDATQAPAPRGVALSPLPAAVEEIAAVRRLAAGAEVLEGASATASLVEERMSRAAVFHFAGHAVPRPDGAALLLGPDAAHPAGLLALQPNTTPPALVVLSACSTARNAQDEIDTAGPLNLARQFLARGSREVIASHWDVDTQASSRFMTLFYASLAGHGDSGRALRDAQRALQADPRFAHPYYWAVYTRLVRNAHSS